MLRLTFSVDATKRTLPSSRTFWRYRLAGQPDKLFGDDGDSAAPPAPTGSTSGSIAHPRGYGAFARLADYYVDGSGGTDYQLLVRHLSTNAADAYRLDQRGRLARGKAADICVLAPPGLVERSSFDNPCRLADGAALVLVNGVPVWADGAPVDGARPGTVVTS